MKNGQGQKTKLKVKNLYMKGERLSNSAKFDESAETYVKIIQMDQIQEKAWHELGKYNRLQKCEESVSHHDDYLRLLPYSSKASEAMTLQRDVDYGLVDQTVDYWRESCTSNVVFQNSGLVNFALIFIHQQGSVCTSFCTVSQTMRNCEWILPCNLSRHSIWLVWFESLIVDHVSIIVKHCLDHWIYTQPQINKRCKEHAKSPDALPTVSWEKSPSRLKTQTIWIFNQLPTTQA